MDRMLKMGCGVKDEGYDVLIVGLGMKAQDYDKKDV